MKDILSMVVSVIFLVVLLIILPLYNYFERQDDMSYNLALKAVTTFVDEVSENGYLDQNMYDKFIQRLATTGNSYDIEMEVKVLDENPGKKTTQADYTKIGENVYYSMYTSQILDTIAPGDGTTKVLALKEGDMFSTSVRNTNTTLSQQLKNFFYTVAGNDTYTIAAEHGGYVTANGSAN